MSDYLVMPIEPRQLAEILEKWLTREGVAFKLIP
jgi:hypothetical protein